MPFLCRPKTLGPGSRCVRCEVAMQSYVIAGRKWMHSLVNRMTVAMQKEDARGRETILS